MPFRIKVSLIIVALLVATVTIVPLVVPIAPPAGVVSLPEAVATADRAGAQQLPVRGAELYVLTTPYSGEGEAPITFVLLHGYASNAFSFDAIRHDLASYGDVVAFDRPGFGLASRPAPTDFPAGENPYSQAAQVAQARELVEGLGLRDVVLVGANSGGVLALEYALQHPGDVAGLVLVGTPAYLLGRGGGAPRWLLGTPQLQRIGPVIMRQLAGPPGEQMYTGAWFDPGRISEAQRAARQAGTSVEGWDKALWQVTLAGAPASLEGRMGQVRAPALVVVGAAAGSVPASESERLASELPLPTLATLDACGDLPQEECPAEFMSLVSSWLESSGLAAK